MPYLLCFAKPRYRISFATMHKPKTAPVCNSNDNLFLLAMFFLNLGEATIIIGAVAGTILSLLIPKPQRCRGSSAPWMVVDLSGKHDPKMECFDPPRFSSTDRHGSPSCLGLAALRQLDVDPDGSNQDTSNHQCGGDDETARIEASNDHERSSRGGLLYYSQEHASWFIGNSRFS